MPDWTKSMQQTFDFFEVDPLTWMDRRKLTQIITGNITFDYDSETLSSMSIDTSEELGECYIRPYLVTIQNGITERFPMGTYLAQTPGSKYNGYRTENSIEAYSPLTELKESYPPFGYALVNGQNILSMAGSLTEDHARAPVITSTGEAVLDEPFVAELDEDWLSYISSLLAKANYFYMLDERGRIIFAPKQDQRSLQPVYTFTDDNSSILYPEMSVERDLYGIPNTVEVIFSRDSGIPLISTATNDDPDSEISTVRRGRPVVYRETNPEFPATPSQEYLDSYAMQLLRDMSSIEYKLTFTHGYCGVRVGDCVRINYKRAGLIDTNAQVIRQSISLEPGCPVEATVVYTKSLWSNNENIE